MVVFGQDSNIIRTFQKVEKDTLIAVIQGAELPSGGPNIADALHTSKMLFFQPSGGARPDSRKIIVIMIDRKSVNTGSQLGKVVDEYERNKVKFVTVVIGDEADPSVLSPLTPDKKNSSVLVTDKDVDPTKVAIDIWDMLGLGK